jgi:hypothetical protein
MSDPTRFVCTKETPWSPDKGKRSSHADAIEVDQSDGWPGGDIVTYECPHCGLRFKEELPQ